MEQMEVTVPAGVSPGMPFSVNTPAGQMQVTCPPDAYAGGKMVVNVPTAQPGIQLAMAQPVMAAPQPMVMQAQPMAMQAQPMMMAAPMAGGGTVEIKLALEHKQKLAEQRAVIPPQLAAKGMDKNDWDEVCRQLQMFQQANFFYDCPGMECVYWCIPGGPVQCVACLFNPITWVVCICPAESKKKEIIAQCNPILNKYSYALKFGEDGMEPKAVIAPVYP